jgi:hypothetical protein
MTKEEEQELIKFLETRGPPNFTEEFWKEFNESMERDNEAFIRREKELTPTDEQMNRRFTI